jgi:hypothetical protein
MKIVKSLILKFGIMVTIKSIQLYMGQFDKIYKVIKYVFTLCNFD